MVMGLKLVIAGRHGEYSRSTDDLTKDGQKQALALAIAIQKMVLRGQSVVLMTSPAARAFETATIIGKQLKVEPRAHEVFHNDEYEDGERMKEVIQNEARAASVVIVITHYKASSGIINAFCREIFSRSVDPEVCRNGCATCLCVETGKVTTLP